MPFCAPFTTVDAGKLRGRRGNKGTCSTEARLTRAV